MEWNERYPASTRPSLDDMARHTGSPLWETLCGYLERDVGASPRIEHSGCSGAPGWNVKYKKSGRSLCTLYPHDGSFTALVCIGERHSGEAEAVLSGCCAYLQELYRHTKPMNGTRWLMIGVTDADTLEGTRRLLEIRAQQTQKPRVR